MKTRTAFPLLLMIFAVLLSADSGAAATPAETKFPHRAACALHLLDVGRVLATYSLSHDGALPHRLSVPYKADMSTAGWTNLICPANVPPLVDGGFYPSYTYVFIEGRKAGETPEGIIAFDNSPVHEGGRNILLGDLENVRYLPENEFQEMLAAERKKTEADGRKFLLVTDDLIQLTRQEQAVLQRKGKTAFDSVYFKAALAIIAAIAGTLILLYLTRRRSATAPKSV